MKKLLILSLSLLVLVACKTSEVIKYEYTSTTMMGKKTLIVTQDSVYTSFTGRGEPTSSARATSASEWSSLNKAVEELKLKDVRDLEAPTNKRATDAAPFGKVTLHTKDSIYQSKTFDGYDSHEALKPLMEQIRKIAESKK
ncbi:MAG: hypothetical protein MI810_12760 [Flavobacteriales bacterium]|nr:hypothetical protein [Flavobacteriales bacterium]